MSSSEFQVTGMSCGHCEVAIRGEVEQVAGVENIEVSAQTGRLVVTGSQPVDDAAILAAVDEAGYQAAPIR
ncbi:heavy-metal-associated domain-containing protein [Agrococcus sp. Ld7]|uniref:heavy-metal-associated domain-containing protein n=1 Tax=Agrococcus sp. Ld7 TaxID=649148 RepID=UPI00386CFD0A